MIRKICFLMVFSLVSFPAAAKDRSVTVSGTCTRSVTPDRGALVVTAEFIEQDIQTAAERATKSYERVKEAVQKLRLESLELKTSEYSVNELREWEKNKTVFKGFKARMGLKISSSSIKRLGEVIAIAARENIRDVGRFSTYLSEEKIRKEQAACLQEAAENARMKAEKLVAALGAKVGEVLTLIEGGGEPVVRPMPNLMDGVETFAGAARGKSMMPPPSVEAGQQEISLAVQAVFALH